MAKKGGMFRSGRKKARGRGAATAGGLDPAMMRQAQELQEQLASAQDELREATDEASAGGRALSVTLGGAHKLRSDTLAPDERPDHRRRQRGHRQVGGALSGADVRPHRRHPRLRRPQRRRARWRWICSRWDSSWWGRPGWRETAGLTP